MNEIKWIRFGKTVTAEGATIAYIGKDTPYVIESRKRHIPHANGRSGTWDHTSYFVLKDGQELIEKYSLKDAKEYAMKHIMEGNNND